MARRRFKEMHDYEWFPDIWRRGMTDFLSFFATYFFQYDPIFPLIEGLIRKSKLRKLRDYCSGRIRLFIISTSLSAEKRNP